MRITDRVEAAGAARECAARLRQECGISDRGPLSLDGLRLVAHHRGIVHVRFNAALASAGLLHYRPGVGFEAAVAHSAGPRGRYSLAHEIGHTFIAAHVARAPLQALKVSPQSLLEVESPLLEEHFCETFAEELLLPTNAARSELQSLSRIAEASEFLSVLERASRRFSLSLRMLLIRAYSARVWPPALLVAVLDAGWLRRRNREDAIEVIAAYSSPESRWYMPNKQLAQGAGLATAVSLTRAWDAWIQGREEAAQSSGAFQIDRGTLRRLDEMNRSGQCVPESVRLKRKEDDGSWSRRVVDLGVLYRLYASSASDAYILAVAKLQPPERQ